MSRRKKQGGIADHLLAPNPMSSDIHNQDKKNDVVSVSQYDVVCTSLLPCQEST